MMDQHLQAGSPQPTYSTKSYQDNFTSAKMAPKGAKQSSVQVILLFSVQCAPKRKYCLK